MSSLLSAEAIAAIDGTVVARLEGNFAGGAAGCANGIVHGAILSTGGIALSGVAAGLTALGFVGETLLGVKLLLSSSEGELLAAIFADDNFVLEHEIPL